MKSIKDYLYECIVTESEETIKDEKSFREWAQAKFKEVFGDDLDKDKMKKTIDGILKDNKDLVDDNKWGELVGKMNEAFAPKDNKE